MKIRFLLPLAALLAVAACAPVRMKGNRATLGAQKVREQTLAGRTHWTLQARLGVSNGKHGGSGSLTWVQDGERYHFLLRAPVTGRSFELNGGPGGAVLEGLDGGPVSGPDAEQLLARVFGWPVPLARLRYWIKGLRAPGAASRLRFGKNQLPSLLRQDGWKVEYRDWFADATPPVPRTVFASKGKDRVRVAIERWSWSRP